MKHSKLMGALLALGTVGLTVSASADDALTALGADITSRIATIEGLVVAAIIAGFAIFGTVWGARKLKSALSAGA
jgi:hypothetical protein